MVLCLSAIGCSVDGGGYDVQALNEWDQDVIVAVTGNTPESRRVPARTYGTLYGSWADPSGELTVFDASCRPIASFPLRSDQTVHIGPAGDVESTEVGLKAPAGVAHDRGDDQTGDTVFLSERCP